MAFFILTRVRSDKRPRYKNAAAKHQQNKINISFLNVPFPNTMHLITKTLGVMWKAQRDVFVFQVEQPNASKKPTKRNVLSTIAALYDPR